MRASKILWSAAILASAMVMSGCGEGNTADSAAGEGTANSQTSQAAAAGADAVPAPMQAFKDDGNVAELAIEGSDMMQFNKDRMTVKAGQMVRLTLTHTGNLPAQSMGHNVVILKPGDDPFEFSTDVNMSGGSLENAYVPVPLRDRVIAFTKIVGGGETTSVEFQAPAQPGEYPFLCSFPGHAGMMNGVLVVE